MPKVGDLCFKCKKGYFVLESYIRGTDYTSEDLFCNNCYVRGNKKPEKKTRSGGETMEGSLDEDEQQEFSWYSWPEYE